LRYAVLSDAHGNLEALEVVLEEADAVGYDRLIFLGDFVGYGANPNECVELIREKASVAVLGNHDSAVLHPEEADYFNEFARKAVLWTRERLTKENMEYLASLPLTARLEEDILVVHASPYRPEKWDYILSVYDAEFHFAHFSEKICLFGHSHIPGVYIKEPDGKITMVEDKPIELEDIKRYLINPGSVGQPRDLDWRASFGLLDTERKVFEFFRVEYDVDKAQLKIKEAGLPEVLAERLAIGY